MKTLLKLVLNVSKNIVYTLKNYVLCGKKKLLSKNLIYLFTYKY